MKLFTLIIYFLAASCAKLESQRQRKMLVPVKISFLEIQECQTYQKNVLDKAYREIKNNSHAVSFISNEDDARTFLSDFQTDKGLYKKKSHLLKNILARCDEELVSQFNNDSKFINQCSLTFSELNFFQSLALALKKYPWPIDLKFEGKRVALDYVSYFSRGDFPLLNRLVALSVLDELSINGIVSVDLHPEIKILMQDAQIYVNQLEQKNSQISRLSCSSLSLLNEELQYSNLIAIKLQKMLLKI